MGWVNPKTAPEIELSSSIFDRRVAHNGLASFGACSGCESWRFIGIQLDSATEYEEIVQRRFRPIVVGLSATCYHAKLRLCSIFGGVVRRHVAAFLRDAGVYSSEMRTYLYAGSQTKNGREVSRSRQTIPAPSVESIMFCRKASILKLSCNRSLELELRNRSLEQLRSSSCERTCL